MCVVFSVCLMVLHIYCWCTSDKIGSNKTQTINLFITFFTLLLFARFIRTHMYMWMNFFSHMAKLDEVVSGCHLSTKAWAIYFAVHMWGIMFTYLFINSEKGMQWLLLTIVFKMVRNDIVHLMLYYLLIKRISQVSFSPFHPIHATHTNT